MNTESASHTAWHMLLMEPMAVLGPYKGTAPSLTSFAPHSLRIDFDHVALAGQFMELPVSPPESWRFDNRYRAYALFDFLEARSIEVQGSPQRATEDDEMHGVPVGQAVSCSLIELPEIFLELPETNKQLRWRKFQLASNEFSLQLEAGSVLLYCGKQAWRR